MFNLLKKSTLVDLENFETLYAVEINNRLSLKKDQLPVVLTTNAEISIKQELRDNTIRNTSVLNKVEGNTTNKEFEAYLEKNLLLADISRRFSIQRNRHGEIKKILNLKELKNDWLRWKENKLYDFVQKLNEQEKFIQNYEKGLSIMEDQLKNELQSIALYPECYSFKSYLSTEKEYTQPHYFTSRLIDKMGISYKLTPTRIDSTEQRVTVEMKSVIANINELSPLLEQMNAQPGYQYAFEITVLYELEKNTGKIIFSQVQLHESLNEFIDYRIQIIAKDMSNPNPNSFYQTFKGKFYTKEEWNKFEEEELKNYARKNNMVLDKNNAKINSGRFFLDEKKRK